MKTTCDHAVLGFLDDRIEVTRWSGEDMEHAVVKLRFGPEGDQGYSVVLSEPDLFRVVAYLQSIYSGPDRTTCQHHGFYSGPECLECLIDAEAHNAAENLARMNASGHFEVAVAGGAVNIGNLTGVSDMHERYKK